MSALFGDAGPLLVLAIVLLAGVTFGSLAKRVRLPSVTGQILIGVLIGPSLANILGLPSLFNHEAVLGLQPVTNFALGLVAVTVGSHLNLRQLRNAGKRLGWLILLEATLTPALVIGGVLAVSDSHWSMAVLLAALAISTAPATIIALIKEARAKGVFVKTLVAGVALNNMACIVLFELAHAMAHAGISPAASEGVWSIVWAPIGALLWATLLGGGAGALLVFLTSRVVSPDRLATASFISILLTSGLADFLGVSPLLSCMFLGIALANLTPDKNEIGHSVFSDFESAIFAVFFTLAGMELDFSYIIPAGAIAAVMFGLRAVGKIVSGNLAMRIAGATTPLCKYLGLSMLPQAGVAVGLMLVIREDSAFAEISDLFLAIGLTVVTMNEIVGPIFTRAGLSKSEEAGKDRARLIDFLREENLVTELSAHNKEDAIRELSNILVQSNHLKIDREAFLKTVLERESEFSTCIGGGLAVPHGVLPEGGEICGAMGISKAGLDFDTPDGVPVHCMVVLGTPPDQRDRHLEVLAALARAIGTDVLIQKQLFNAKSPAHAYEILHAEEFEDFNYFLSD